MKMYITPIISVYCIDVELLSTSDAGPGATDIGSPSVGGKSSVWDEEEDTHYLNNNNKEENYEVYE